ncbi:Nucleoporin [Meyerozyma sp. JA9]|nr:Nucleoporin [Meyerozyma sp. JA9]
MAQSIFQVRSRPSSAVSTPKKSRNDPPSSLATHKLTELTKNRQYCVSKLPALPSHLNIADGEQCNGYCDHLSGYFVVAQKSSINVWNYRSSDSAPLTYQFPVEDAGEFPPLASLTRPASATSQDPGIVIVNCTTGNVKFYESVQHAPALGLIHSKSSELVLPLQSNKGEYVTMAQNVEPAGVIIATSWKRCILISLRDQKSKPQLTTLELLPPYNTGLMSRLNIFKGLAKADMDEIVSIRCGFVGDDDLTQDIIIQDSIGGFYLFTYQVMSPNGVSSIISRNSFKQNILRGIESSIDGYLPGSTPNLRIMDLWPLKDIYICLCLIDDKTITGDEKNLVLVSAKIDNTGVLVYRSHRLTRCTYTFSIESPQRPRLFIPSPGKTAFVSLGNSIIMTDIDVPYSQQGQIQYYKPRWEDIFRLKPSIQVVGYGYENQSTNANPALVVLTANSGVLRLERFSDTEDITMKDADGTTSTLKSHIEQAVYYSESATIDFDIVDEFPIDVIVQSVSEVSEEILNSTSPYLPSFLPSIKDYLSLKVTKYRNLILFVHRNFPQLKSTLVPPLVENLEKVEVSMFLWEFLSSHGDETKSWLEDTIKSATGTNTEDPVRSFFATGNKDINQVLTDLLEKMIRNNVSLTKITNLITSTMYKGVFLNEEKYITVDDTIEPKRLWIYDTNLLLRLEEIYTKAYCEGNKSEHQSKDYLEEMAQFCEVLYYFVTTAIGIMQRDGGNHEQLVEYIRWYKQRKMAWIDSLLDSNQVDEAFSLAQTYRDFSSLARVLDFSKERILNEHGADSDEYAAILEKYDYYFSIFGEEFAFKLFDYYVKTDKVQALFSDFADHPLLAQYFVNNKERAADFSWIKYLSDSDFTSASEALLQSVERKVNENQASRQIKFSLAKLAAIASKKDSAVASSEALRVAENGLVVTRIQNRLYQDLVKAVSNNMSVLTFQFLSKNFVNSDVSTTEAQATLEESFGRLLKNQPLAVADLVNYLTLIKPSISSHHNYADALRVAGVSGGENTSYLEHIIWLRVLTVTDDWSVLSQTKDKSDEFVKQRTKDTVLYKTVCQAQSTSSLTSLVHHGLSVRDTDAAAALDKRLLQKLEDSIDKHDLTTWIESIIQDAKS